MSSIKLHLIQRCLLAALLLVLAGCGSKNPNSTFSTASGGAHTAANWLPAGHMTAANSDLGSCAVCHGSDYSGGTSKVACTECHMGDQQNVHPLDWGYLAYAKHGAYAKTTGIASCNNMYCHGKTLTGVATSGPSCTSCHLGGPMQVHPGNYSSTATDFTDWSTNTTSSNFHGTYVTNNGINSCANAVCHGTYLKGVTGSGSSCQACHANYTSFYAMATKK
jgi:hypothetical protein